MLTAGTEGAEAHWGEIWGDEGGLEGIAINLTLQLNLERRRGVSLMVEVKKDIKGKGNSMCQRERGGKSGKRAGYRKARKKTCLTMLNGTGSGKSRTEVLFVKFIFQLELMKSNHFPSWGQCTQD